MPGVVVPVQLNYAIRCDQCQKPFKRLYPILIDGQKFMLCSEPCIVKSQNNWEEKKKLGLTNPDLPVDLTFPQDSMETEMDIPE